MPNYRCKRCNYLYIDDEQNQCFEDVDEKEWRCPRCKCSKNMFVKLNQ